MLSFPRVTDGRVVLLRLGEPAASEVARLEDLFVIAILWILRADAVK